MEREMARIGGTGISARGTVTSWQEALAQFVGSQDVKENSRAVYLRTLKLFFEWMEQTGRQVSALTRLDILEYKDGLWGRGLSPLTVGAYITSVRKFYEWAEAMKIYPNIAKGIKTPKRQQAFKKQHLTEEKGGELLDHFKGLSLRDFAIVNLLLHTGLRTIEVVRADVGDMTFRGNARILKVWGKGRDAKDDFVVLTDETYTPIRNYLATRKGARDGDPLFASDSHRNAGQRLTTRTISGICKAGLKAIGLDGREFTAHSLRHTTAVMILKRGGRLTDAQMVLRHTNPATTQIYVESIKEEMRLRTAPECLLDGAFSRAGS